MIPPPQSPEALGRTLQERQWTTVLDGLLCALPASHLPTTWSLAMRRAWTPQRPLRKTTDAL